MKNRGSGFFPQVLTFYSACSAGNGKCLWQLPPLLQPGCSDLKRLSAIETVHGWSCDRPGVSRKMFVSPCSSCKKQGEQAVRSREQFPAPCCDAFSANVPLATQRCSFRIFPVLYTPKAFGVHRRPFPSFPGLYGGSIYAIGTWGDPC